MKLSEVTIEELKKYANVYHDEDDILFGQILTACKAYIRGYTGLTDETMDDNDDLVLACYVLSNELYDNRAYNIESAKANLVVKAILDMHSTNLL